MFIYFDGLKSYVHSGIAREKAATFDVAKYTERRARNERYSQRKQEFYW